PVLWSKGYAGAVAITRQSQSHKYTTARRRNPGGFVASCISSVRGGGPPLIDGAFDGASVEAAMFRVRAAPVRHKERGSPRREKPITTLTGGFASGTPNGI